MKSEIVTKTLRIILGSYQLLVAFYCFAFLIASTVAISAHGGLPSRNDAAQAIMAVLLLLPAAVYCACNGIRLWSSRFSFARWKSLAGTSYLLTLLVTGFFLYLLCSIYADYSATRERIKLIGRPEIRFMAVDGRSVDLAAMQGKVVLVDFWATWCGPCRASLPKLVQAYTQFHDKGFEVVGISLDQDKTALERFVRENHIAWPQYFDGKGFDNAFAKQYGIRAIPAMWLVDKDGSLRQIVDGDSDIVSKVRELLAN